MANLIASRYVLIVWGIITVSLCAMEPDSDEKCGIKLTRSQRDLGWVEVQEKGLTMADLFNMAFNPSDRPRPQTEMVFSAMLEAKKTPEEMLFQAIESGKPRLVSLVFRKGPQLTYADRFGDTPLHRAIEKNNTFIINQLLLKHADHSLLNKMNLSPLMIALTMGKRNIIDTCLDHGQGDINVQGLKGWTALHMAVINKDIKTITHLLNKRASIALADGNGKTPIHYAATAQHAEMWKALLRDGWRSRWDYIDDHVNEYVQWLEELLQQGDNTQQTPRSLARSSSDFTDAILQRSQLEQTIRSILDIKPSKKKHHTKKKHKKKRSSLTS